MIRIMSYLRKQTNLLVTRKQSYQRVTIAILCAGCSAVSVQAQSVTVDTVTNVKLSPADAVQHDQPISRTYDFGKQDAFGSRLVAHTFLVRNAGEKPIVLDRAVSSCSCTTAFVGEGTTSTLPLVLKPNAEVSLIVSINAKELFPGSISKSVSLFARGQSTPIAVFGITGDLQPAATFVPAVLQVGTVKVGQPASFLLTVLLDKRLVKNGEPPHLVSYDSRVQVEAAPLNPHSSAALSAENSASGLHEGKEYLTQAYRVTVNPSGELGFLDGMLALAAAHQTAPLSFSLGTSIHVMGNVDGEIHALPSMIAFEEIEQGKGATQRAIVTSLLANELQGLKVDSPMLCFQARLVPAADNLAAETSLSAQTLLEVTVKPNTPVGSYSSQIIVTTSGGQRLVIPVVATVTSSKGAP